MKIVVLLVCHIFFMGRTDAISVGMHLARIAGETINIIFDDAHKYRTFFLVIFLHGAAFAYFWKCFESLMHMIGSPVIVFHKKCDLIFRPLNFAHLLHVHSNVK